MVGVCGNLIPWVVGSKKSALFPLQVFFLIALIPILLISESDRYAQLMHMHYILRLSRLFPYNLFQQITAQQLNDTLKGIFEAFHARSNYLNCMKDPTLRPPSGTIQGAPAVGMYRLE